MPVCRDEQQSEVHLDLRRSQWYREISRPEIKPSNHPQKTQSSSLKTKYKIDKFWCISASTKIKMTFKFLYSIIIVTTGSSMPESSQNIA